MKLGYVIDQIVKMWEILMTIGKIWLIFKRMCFSQNYTGMNSSHKNEARKLKFGLEVPMVLRTLGTDFWIVDFF